MVQDPLAREWSHPQLRRFPHQLVHCRQSLKWSWQLTLTTTLLPYTAFLNLQCPGTLLISSSNWFDLESPWKHTSVSMRVFSETFNRAEKTEDNLQEFILSNMHFRGMDSGHWSWQEASLLCEPHCWPGPILSLFLISVSVFTWCGGSAFTPSAS